MRLILIVWFYIDLSLRWVTLAEVSMTKKPLSTISFNSEEFLLLRLSDFVESEQLQSWLYVKHLAEKDTTKDHIHLLLIPNRPVDPQSLRRKFYEPSPIAGQSDLGCLPMQSSKVDDWLLYALHYPPYLLKKGLVRVNTYCLDDVKSNEPREFLDDIFHRASEELNDNRISMFLDRMRHGESFGQILSSGLVPPNQIVFYDKLYLLNAHIFCEKLDDFGNDTIPF